jgi:hypothetical protein
MYTKLLMLEMCVKEKVGTEAEAADPVRPARAIRESMSDFFLELFARIVNTIASLHRILPTLVSFLHINHHDPKNPLPCFKTGRAPSAKVTAGIRPHKTTARHASNTCHPMVLGRTSY